MEKYLKLPFEDYQKIRKTLDGLLGKLDGKEYHEVLYIGNILFEVTHDFDSGKPYLYSDDPTSKYLTEKFGEYYPDHKSIRVIYPEGTDTTQVEIIYPNNIKEVYEYTAGSDDDWWDFEEIGSKTRITIPFNNNH